MKHRIILTPEATADRERLVAFLLDVNPRAALNVADTIIEALAALALFPERGALMGNGLRQLIIPFGTSGYVAQYRVDPGVVIIARVFHMREAR
ncbi:MAG: type II toxin-antitoxin system RelE/ParE family toxin [Caulobacterales bacterium]|nr:type II toxin-antitoxin system RelE/ParE family toxin [Caulobacterales bacterium]